MLWESGDKDAVVEYVFQRTENTEVALRILAEEERIKRRIAREFVETVETRLQKSFSDRGAGWGIVNQLKKDALDRRKLIGVQKKSWDGLYCIGLMSEDKNGRRFMCGVWNDWEKLRMRVDGGKISDAIKAAEVRSGWTTDWWPYGAWMERDRNWWDERTLGKMIGEDRELFAYELVDIIVRIADAVEITIDAVIEDARAMIEDGALPNKAF